MSLETQVSMITGMIKWILDKAIPIMVIIALAFALYWFWGWLQKRKQKSTQEIETNKPDKVKMFVDGADKLLNRMFGKLNNTGEKNGTNK